MSEIDRRTFIKGAGVATGVAATGAGAGSLDLYPVQEAEAIPPLVIGAGVAAGGVALGWALREFEVIGADDPPEGLTADALRQHVYETALKRESFTNSTIVDNQNIIESGIGNAAYVDGKIAAFEALNAGKSQSETQSAMLAPVNDFEQTVVSNFGKSWNEAASEFQNLLSRIQSHSDTDPSNIFISATNDSYHVTGLDGTSTSTVNFDNGNTFDFTVLSVSEGGPGSRTATLDPTADPPTDYGGSGYDVTNPDTGDSARILPYYTFGDMLNQLQTTFQNARDGLITWLDSVYGQVQSGEIEVSDLITPKERAAMMTDDGKYPQAVADLVALNVPVDFEREATVSLDWHDDDVTLNGTLAITSPPDNLTPGTYDPQADSLGSVYLTYDVGAAEGVWTAYDDAKGVDGGTVEFESEPYEGVTYDIVTNYDETASVTAGDFTKGTDGSSNTVWTVDVSDQLENSIAEISEVTYYTDTDETRYETIQMQGTFTIEKFTNTETGEQADSASFTSPEPQDDSNYVTQEEWNQLEQQNKELIEKYEDSQSGGGGLFPDTGIPGWGIVVAVGGIALVLLGQSDDNGY